MKYHTRIDLHMHTTLSDGTDPPEEIPARVKEAGITLFSVTDHDSVKSARIIAPLLREGDPEFLPGAEFSCRDEDGKYHILGYGYDPDTKAMKDLAELGHSFRMNKVKARLEYLKTQFGFTFPEEELRQLLAMDNPGKPHIGNLMVKMGYARSKEQAIKEFIDRIRFIAGHHSCSGHRIDGIRLIDGRRSFRRRNGFRLGNDRFRLRDCHDLLFRRNRFRHLLRNILGSIRNGRCGQDHGRSQKQRQYPSCFFIHVASFLTKKSLFRSGNHFMHRIRQISHLTSKHLTLDNMRKYFNRIQDI